MDISWCILLFIIVCLGAVGTIGAVTSTKETHERGEPKCKTDLDCKPIETTFNLNATPEMISLPTHCLNILNKTGHRCAWLWPEGLAGVAELDEYLDPADPSSDTTTNMRDWMKSRKYDLYTSLDLNKLPQHHQTIEIVDEKMCPFPFMDFIPLGSRYIVRRNTDLELFEEEGWTPQCSDDDFMLNEAYEAGEAIEQTFGVCAVSPSNIRRVLERIETPTNLSVQGALNRFRTSN